MSETDVLGMWLRKARSDLLAVANNLAADETPWDVVAFHAQQAAEKALKALLVHFGTRPPRTHDCAALLDMCLPHDEGLGRFQEACQALGQLGVWPRYPAFRDEPSPETVRALVWEARDLVLVVAGKLDILFDDPLPPPSTPAASQEESP